MKYKTRFAAFNIVAAQSFLEEEITGCGFTKYKILDCVISPYKKIDSPTGDKITHYEFNYEVEVMGFDA